MGGIGQHIEYAQNFIAQVDAQHAQNIARESAMSSDKTRKNTERLFLVARFSLGSCSVRGAAHRPKEAPLPMQGRKGHGTPCISGGVFLCHQHYT